MNEEGLVVELMWLEDTAYPPADARGALPALQWIQYQLDTCGRVAEVLASDAVVRIEEGTSAKIHYLVADATGDAAAIEWLNGVMIVHRGDGLPVRALTNDTYERSLAHLATLADGADARSMASLDRFVRAGEGLASIGGASRASAVGAAFDVLGAVAQGNFTCWSIVYDVALREVHFRTRGNERVRTVKLRELEFRCDVPVLVLDVNARVAGDASRSLTPYTLERNTSLVRSSFAKTDFLQGVPAEVVDALARAPEGMPCTP
jgi:choloylglycine hydrolase